MFLADVQRQRAFRKLGKWLFGGLVVGLKLRRQQLGCHLGFKLGSARRLKATRQVNLFQVACMSGAIGRQMGWKIGNYQKHM